MTTPEAGLHWRYTEGREAELVAGDVTLARYHFAVDRKKAFVHPLRTRGGTLLTAFEPSDHVWHRGVWFAWKYLDGTNYWEELTEEDLPDASTLPDGMSLEDVYGRVGGVVERVGQEAVSFSPGRAVIDTTYSYRPPTGREVMRERRTLVIHAPDTSSHLTLDWRHLFEARAAPVVIDRAPIEVFAVGGYAGFSWRAASSLTSFRALDSEGRTDGAVEHARARWVDLSGAVAGGEDVIAGLAIFDHPTNQRHPTHWRCIFEPGFGFLNAAFVLAEPYVLEPGRPLELRYRALAHDGWADPDELEREAQRYAENG